eukprot:2731444-Amphidinium_carterae.1
MPLTCNRHVTSTARVAEDKTIPRLVAAGNYTTPSSVRDYGSFIPTCLLFASRLIPCFKAKTSSFKGRES